MRFRSATSLTEEHVGRRVTVRRRLPDGGVGDVIGILESVSPTTLHVRARDGILVEVARADVVAARVIADRA